MPSQSLLDDSPCLNPALFDADPQTVLGTALPFDNAVPLPTSEAVLATASASRRPRTSAATPTISPTKLSKRVQRVMRTREAATRNRQEQRAKMLRLTTDNARLQAQTSALATQNRKLKADVRLILALKADPDLLRRVLAQPH